ncbi:MAG: protease HtpX [Bacteriovoracaceae bacterium]
MWFKRIFLFMAMNILVMVSISIVMSILGVKPYLTSYGLNYESLMIFCLVWGMVGSFISLMLSKFMAKMMMGVKIVDSNGPHRDLVLRVHNLAKAAGISKMPEVGVYESAEVNAFATGPTKNNSLIAVSTGLLNRMSDDAVEGVLGHEVSHVANGDMVTMALVQGVVNAFVMFFARIAAFALQNVLRGDDDREEGSSFGGGFAYHISVFVFEIFFSFLGMFVVSYFSRIREFRADAGSAKVAGREKMITALQQLKGNMELIDNSKPNLRCMKISDKGSFMALLSTHPSLDDRIMALQNYRAV